jgi:hypothetical protein
MWGKVKLDRCDILFSNYLRGKIGHCEFCKRSNIRLEASHYFGRRHEATRFDPENVDVLCSYHHRLFHERPADYTEWKKKKLGDKRYKLLEVRSNTYMKKDRKLMLIYLKALIKSDK